MSYCEEHERTKNELEKCKSKITIFEALMNKIDKELTDIKNDIKNRAD